MNNIDEDYIICVQSQIEMLKVDRDDWKTKFELLKRENDKLKEDYADLNCHYAAALDKINELENPWISVEDRMPDEGVNVLTYGARPFYDVVYINRLIDKDEWLYDGVTHWMSLPHPPEKE